MRPLRFTNVSANLPLLPIQNGHDATQASFPIARSWLPPFSREPYEAHHHGHEHGTGKVPLDLDEAAYGAKSIAKVLGPWTQRLILGGGIYYAFDGSHHAFEDLCAFPSQRSAIAHTRQRIDAPLEFLPATSFDAQRIAQRNQAAVQHIAARHQVDSYAGLVLSAASFVGCLFMGLGLSFDDQMLGYVFPSVVEHTGTCMDVAVPMMVLYALGVAATAGRDLVNNWNRGQALGAAGRALHVASTPQGVSLVEKQAHSVAEASLKQRQKLSGMAIIAGCAMGIGVGLTCWVSLWGLALMMPGALSLPGIMAQRHTPKVSEASLSSKVNSGSLEDISNDLVHLDAQQNAIQTRIRSAATCVRTRWGMQDFYFDTPVHTASAYLKERYLATQTHLRNVRVGEADPATQAANTAILAEHSRMGTASELEHHQYVYRAMLDVLIEDGLFETFAFEVVKSPEARRHLSHTADDADHIDISRASLLSLPALGADPTWSEAYTQEQRTQQVAHIFLRLMHTDGYQALADTKEHTLDLWLERRDAQAASVA